MTRNQLRLRLFAVIVAGIAFWGLCAFAAVKFVKWAWGV